MNKILIDELEFINIKKENEEIKKKYNDIKKCVSAILNFKNDNDETKLKSVYIDLIKNKLNETELIEKYKEQELNTVYEKNNENKKIIDKQEKKIQELNNIISSITNSFNNIKNNNKKLNNIVSKLTNEIQVYKDEKMQQEKNIKILKEKLSAIVKDSFNSKIENKKSKYSFEELLKKNEELCNKIQKVEEENEEYKKQLNLKIQNDGNSVIEENIKLNQMIEEFENGSKKKKEELIQKGVTICLTAWQTQNYIEECLDSIENQTYFKEFNEYEILLGIDHCEKTLQKVKQIQHKYRNLKVFMMNENVGTYITTNTMMSIAKYDTILRFDTDDVMLPNMLEIVLSFAQNTDADIVRPYAVNFGHRTSLLYDKHGCILIKKQIFKDFGGYMPWKCAADGELQKRLEKFVKIKKCTTVVFKRRIHYNNLTIAKDTNFKSKLRKSYISQIHTPASRKEAIIKCVTANFEEIELDNKYRPIVSLTSYPDRFKYVPSVITSILNNTMKPYKICLCLYKEDVTHLTNQLKELINSNTVELIIAEENLKPHCKYYYTMKKYKDHPIITIDDDLLYNIYTVKSLYDSYLKHPNCISARRVHKIAYEDGIAANYGKWTREYTKELTPKKYLFATGVGGVLYPPDILKIDDISVEDINRCLLADDILLKWREDRLNILTIWVSNNSMNGIKINEAANSQKALFRTNCNKSKNTEYLKIFKLYE